MTHLAINVSGTGNFTIVAGSGGSPNINIQAMFLQCSIATTLTVRAGTTDLTGPMMFPATGQISIFNTGGTILSAAGGVDLIFHLSGLTGGVAGWIEYTQS